MSISVINRQLPWQVSWAIEAVSDEESPEWVLALAKKVIYDWVDNPRVFLQE